MITLQRTDTGIQFIVTVTNKQTGAVVNLSAATGILFIFRKPDKTVYSQNGSLYTDGTDGKLTYTSDSSDLDVYGIWRLQVSYTINSNTKLSSEVSFLVDKNLSDL